MKNQEIEEKARELADMVGSVAVDENLPLEVIEYALNIARTQRKEGQHGGQQNREAHSGIPKREAVRVS